MNERVKMCGCMNTVILLIANREFEKFKATSFFRVSISLSRSEFVPIQSQVF